MTYFYHTYPLIIIKIQYIYNMKAKETNIYALMDGTNVKYIGKADNIEKRLSEHIKESQKNKKTYKHKWINKMLVNNKEITIKILETVPYNIWEEREIYWIEQYGLKNLVNGTIGGNGRKYEEDMKRDKNLKITQKTHELLKKYCEHNGLKMFAFVEKIIKDKCTVKKGLYDDEE